jgi:signal transduction histidine kinase
MPTAEVILIFTALVNLIIGLAVYLTNPVRAQNRQFLFFSVNVSLWGVMVWGAISADAAGQAGLFIRIASYVSALIPLTFHLLCLSIGSPQAEFPSLLKRSRFLAIASQLAGGLCFTPLYMQSVAMPEQAGSFPEAQYGPAFIFYNVYFPLAFGSTIFRFVRNMLKARGQTRSEYQYILLGMSCTLIFALTTQVVLPSLTGSSQTQPFGPLSIIAMNGIIAYGIATRRILEVAYILQRIAAYLLLTVYLVALYTVTWLFTEWLFIPRGLPPSMPHLLAALAVAFSMAPANTFAQRFANRLFLAKHAMDVGATVSEVNSLLQGITTMPTLLRRFSDTVARSVGTDSVQLLLLNHTGYQQRYPEPVEEQPARQIDAQDPVANELQAVREPIVSYELSRQRPTPRLRELERRMDDLNSAVAVGIRTSHRLEGILLLGQRMSGRIYGTREINTLQILCDQLAVALENTELYTQTENSKIYNEILLDNLTSGVIAVNAEGRITVMNREAHRLTGLTGQDVIGQSMELLPRMLADAIRYCFASHSGLRDQDAALPGGPGQEPVPIRISSSAFRGFNQRVLGGLVVFNDQSAIRKLETQIRRTDRLASIGTLAAGMAHEIKNPLVTIKTFTQLLPERYQDDEFRDTFSTLVGHEVKRIDSIVNQLLRFARPTKPDLAPTHFNEVIEHSLRLVEQQLKQKNITLRKELAAGADLIQADANILQQALINFLLNAIDSMFGGGELFVRTEEVERHPGLPVSAPTRPAVKVIIRDSGEGIRKEDLPHIFDPFFTTKSHGTGLGLSVTHGIIQDHNGFIDVDSVVRQGTTIQVFFPLIAQEAVV